jgi:hypothetical protein
LSSFQLAGSAYAKARAGFHVQQHIEDFYSTARFVERLGHTERLDPQRWELVRAAVDTAMFLNLH